MNQVKFFIDNSENISSQDLINVRTFYLPIIGVEGIGLYHHFYDLYNINNTKKYDLFETSEFLTLDLNTLEIAKNKLEATGLIRTFQDKDGNLLIKLNKPLNANQVSKNDLISGLLISKIGKSKYSKLIKNNANYFQDISKMCDVSKSFFDIFNNKEIYNNEPECFDFTLVDESDMLNSLKSEQYINYFTKRELSPSQILMLKKMKLLKFGDSAINAFVKYSINVNNSIVCNYIEKIANDFAKRNLFEADLIDSELTEAANFKNKNNIISKIDSKLDFDLDNYSDSLNWDD